MQEITIKRPGTAAAATSVKSSAFLLPEEPAASVQQTVESAAKIPNTLLIPEEPETPSALLVPEEPETPKASTATKTRKLFIRTFGCQMNEYDSDKMADVLREDQGVELRSDEHPSELQSLMRISYAVFCLQKTKYTTH